MQALVGPTGNTIKGNVLDVRLKPLLRACHDIEPRLYFKWNPNKNSGCGVWELRIRPTEKSKILVSKEDGKKLFLMEYKENDFEHHVKDFSSLNYSILDWLRKHDTFAVHKWQDHVEYEGDRYIERQETKALEERKYYIRHERKAMRTLKDAVYHGELDVSRLLG